MSSGTDESVEEMNRSNICSVCGFEKSKKAYGAITCSSCKVFFRRNECLNLDMNHCQTQGKCQINFENRKMCRYCRLQKCFQVGMTEQFFRPSHTKINPNKSQITHNISNEQNVKVITNEIIDKCAELTFDEQSELFNIIDSYDIYSPISNIINIIENSLNNPSKIRLKLMKNNLIIIEEYFYSSIISFIKINQKYSSLIINDKKKLIQRNIRNLSHLNQLFIFNQINFLNDSIHQTIILEQYGQLYINNLIINIQNISQDTKIIKIFLIILIFSTCSDVIQFNINEFKEEDNLLSSTINIFNIQNIYVEIIFKYLIIHYGYEEALKQFQNLIQILLKQIKYLQIDLIHEKHYQIIQNILQQDSTIDNYQIMDTSN